MFFEVIPTEVFRENGGVLTYHSSEKLIPGQIVLIPLGRKTITGIVARRIAKVGFPTKDIIRVIHPYPIPKHLLNATRWLSEYYLTPLPTTANLMIPAGLTSRTMLKSNKEKTSEQLVKVATKDVDGTSSLFSGTSAGHDRGRAGQHPRRRAGATAFPERADCAKLRLPLIDLNTAQKKALKALQEAPGATRLLLGVTGSGKTNIYLKMAADTLREQKSVILLVPEIALTSQLVRIFEEAFGNLVTLIHSKQTMAERRQTWLNLLQTTYDNGVAVASVASRGGAELTNEHAACETRNDGLKQRVPREATEATATPLPRIIIGPRSALLSPVHNLGLIIIDEAHEGAYYQENNPRYSALRLASFIASQLKIPCIAGTATPNIVDYHLAKTHHSLVELSEKAKSTAITPDIEVVDLKDRTNFPRNRYFSNQLLTKIEKNLQDKHQTLIFHNRRGSSPLTICEECGWQALCPECYLPMTLHADGYLLTCHICGHEEKVPSSCPNCHHAGIIHKGFGTKLLETELQRLFPKAKIARFDGDNKKTDNLAELYQSVRSGKIDILIGTQTLARGLDLPHLATVGIVQADAGLSLPDFAAEERSYELLTQVIGRVGRGHLDVAEVIIQTYQPDHPVIQTSIQGKYPDFANYLIRKRHEQQLPPFTYLARLDITYKTEKTTLTKIKQAYSVLSKNPDLQVSPPMPAFHERTGRGFTWQLMLKATSREALRKALVPFAKFHLELDPPSML